MSNESEDRAVNIINGKAKAKDETEASRSYGSSNSKGDEPRFGHPDPRLDTDPSRQQQPVKRSSALSTASASASTLSTWD